MGASQALYESFASSLSGFVVILLPFLTWKQIFSAQIPWAKSTRPYFYIKYLYTIQRKLFTRALNTKSITHVFMKPPQCRLLSLHLKINNLYQFYSLQRKYSLYNDCDMFGWTNKILKYLHFHLKGSWISTFWSYLLLHLEDQITLK